MPRQAKMMDETAIVRGIKSNDLGDINQMWCYKPTSNAPKTKTPS